jgi:HAD superfamily hydrolase (TIGR01509 family)
VTGASPRHSVDALLFDLGGVVYEIDFSRAFTVWARHGQCAATSIAAAFSHDIFYQRHERGEIDAGQYFASLRVSLGLSMSDAAFIEGWNAIYGNEIAAMRPLLRRLKTSTRLYAFTNSNPTHQAVWATRYSGVLAVFDRVFTSSEMGQRKPEAGAFETISATIGVPLARMVFFDDTEEHVRGARAIGLRAVHVTSVAAVETALCQFLE